MDVLFSFFQQVLAYFISGTFHNSWSAVERKFFSYSSLSIYFTKFNFIFHFTLKKMEKWNSWQKLYFWCKTKEFLLTKWILDLTLSTIFLTSLEFFFAEFRITTAHCWTVYCDFVLFFQCRAKLTLQYLSETFYFSVIFEWLPDYSWHLLIFFPFFFSFHLTLFFFSSSLFARIFRYPSFSQSTLFPRQVPFGDYLLMFLLTTFFLHKSSQSSVSK